MLRFVGVVLGGLITALAIVIPNLAFAQVTDLTEDEVKARWGLYAELAGRDFVFCEGTCVNGHMVSAYRWEVPGRILSVCGWNFSHSYSCSKYVWTETRGVEAQADKGPVALISLESDGSVTLRNPESDRYISRMRLNGNSLLFDTQTKGKVTWSDPQIYTDVSATKPSVREKLAKRFASKGVFPGEPIQFAKAEPPAIQQAVQSTVQPSAFPTPSTPTLAAAAPVYQSAAVSSGPRFALVIGNSEYGAKQGRLPNPVNDADLLAQSLREVGFDVELVKNADQKGMKRAISRLGERMTAGGNGSVGFFFFAGHGIQSRGVNYLIPVGANIEREADVDLEAVAADTVLLQMEEVPGSTNIVVLDACRNMPLARSFRSGSRGLARMDAPNGSFISYSTAPGSVAADGDGTNSPFASALSERLKHKGEPIEITFREVRRAVLEATGGTQTPWDSSSLIDTFVFAPL